jgi:hypothetical protein
VVLGRDDARLAHRPASGNLLTGMGVAQTLEKLTGEPGDLSLCCGELPAPRGVSTTSHDQWDGHGHGEQ